MSLKKYHQNNITRFFDYGPLPIKTSAYTSAALYVTIIIISF